MPVRSTVPLNQSHSNRLNAANGLPATYIIQMSLHVDQCESLLEKYDEHSAWDPILIKAVFVHIRLLSKAKRRMFEAYKQRH